MTSPTTTKSPSTNPKGISDMKKKICIQGTFFDKKNILRSEYYFRYKPRAVFKTEREQNKGHGVAVAGTYMHDVLERDIVLPHRIGRPKHDPAYTRIRALQPVNVLGFVSEGLLIAREHLEYPAQDEEER
jgi:hypothetical protein